MSEVSAKKDFYTLIANIQAAYPNWAEFSKMLKKAGLDAKDLRKAKKIFDKERSNK